MIDPTKVDILAAIKDLDFDPPQWDKRPCDELDEATIAEIDADVTELCRQKFNQLVADYHSLAAVATRLREEAVLWQSKAIRQQCVIALLGLALLVAVGILTR